LYLYVVYIGLLRPFLWLLDTLQLRM